MTETHPASTNGYVPITCSLHSQYELAILRRQWLRLVWTDDGLVRTETVLPLDLVTKEHAEFLVYRTEDGATHRARLDHVHSMEPT